MELPIEINEVSPKPIYVQIQDSIINGVQNKTLDPNSQLPSINEVSDGLNIARKTVEKAYNHLKRKKTFLGRPWCAAPVRIRCGAAKVELHGRR